MTWYLKRVAALLAVIAVVIIIGVIKMLLI